MLKHSRHLRAALAGSAALMTTGWFGVVASPAGAAGTTTFNVGSFADDGLQNSGGSTCVATNGLCTLRAAVEAADNLGTRVAIVLPGGTYTLDSGVLEVTDPGGVSITGAGETTTTVSGGGSQGVFELTPASDTVAGPELSMTDLTVADGSSADGAALDMVNGAQGGSAVLTDVKFSDDVATSYGGAIATEASGGDTFADDMVLDDCAFSGDSAGTYGGAIYAYWSDLSLTGTTFSGNTAEDGGAIASEFGSITMQGGSLDDTASSDGGDLYLEYGTATLDKTSLEGTAESGGAVYETYEQATLSGITSANAAATGVSGNNGGRGGSIYQDYGTMSITGSTFAKDTADVQGTDAGEGGAVYAEGDTTMSGDTFSDDSAAGGDGGAVYNYWGLDIARSTFGGDTAEYGGSIYNYDSLVISGSSFNDDSATGDGGAIYNYDPMTVSGSTFSDDTTSGDGGAVYLYYYGGTVNTSTFSGDSAENGGALYDEIDETGSSFSQDTFKDNTASEAGGAAYSDADYSADAFTAATVEGNKAPEGGAFATSEDGYVLEVTGSTIADNTATAALGSAGAGGAFYSAGGLTTLTQDTITGNTAQADGPTAGQGGAIYDTYDGMPVLSFDTVVGNTAGEGAAIYYDGGLGGSIRSSILAANRSGSTEADCDVASTPSVLVSEGGNVLGRAACVGDEQSSDLVTKAPGVSGLASNGGRLETMALTASSPALGRGTICPSTDERGEPRPASGCDAGAYQRAPGVVSKVSPTEGAPGATVTITGTGFTFARTVTFGSAKASFTIKSDTEITAKVPAKLVKGSKVTVTVTTPDGHGATATFKIS
jgi:predicted outer membrane repeat protein